MQPQQEKSWGQKQQEGFNLFSWFIAIHSICIYPFIRSGYGVRGIGTPGFWAMLIIPLYAGTMQSEEMLTYWWAWVAMVVWRRVTASRYQISKYPGWPWFASWMTFG